MNIFKNISTTAFHLLVRVKQPDSDLLWIRVQDWNIVTSYSSEILTAVRPIIVKKFSVILIKRILNLLFCQVPQVSILRIYYDRENL